MFLNNDKVNQEKYIWGVSTVDFILFYSFINNLLIITLTQNKMLI